MAKATNRCSKMVEGKKSNIPYKTAYQLHFAGLWSEPLSSLTKMSFELCQACGERDGGGGSFIFLASWNRGMPRLHCLVALEVSSLNDT